jgi:tRNA-specific 2-thiouridylase
MKNKTKVLLAMSGGVDSSVAALLMKKKGYEVIGAFMKNWSDTKDKFGECNWKGERKMAMKIAKKLEIPLITLDFEKQYKRDIVSKMFEDYKKGITPNPDVDCNQKVKFPLLIKEAKKLGADFVVTGHYSRIKKIKEKYELHRAKDETKDQSYFLYRLNQNELKHALFPIGDYTKKQVRKIAEENNFPNFDKKSTVGICFIGNIDFKKFLKEKIKEKKGKILNPEGKLIGEHNGVYYYTIGERLGPRYGFEISKDSDDKKSLKRWYVAKKNLRKNEIIAAPQNHPLLLRKEMAIKNVHWINKNPFNEDKKKTKKVLSRIRQVGELLPSKLFYDKKKKQIRLTLNKAITGVSQGQAIVLYKGKEVLGGGEIRF